MDSVPSPKGKKRSMQYIPRDASLPILDEELRICEFKPNQRKHHIGYLQTDHVLVKDQESMKTLYSKGFFGKGTLSKSGPQLCFPNQSKKSSVTIKSEPVESDANEDSGDSEIIDYFSSEELQLSFVEAYFLCYGLGCLIVMDQDKPMDLLTLWQKFCDLTPHNEFPYLYTAYHHYRSKGWVVRLGLTYGIDFLLYKDGPCYYHSSLAIVVKPVYERNLKAIPGSNKLETWTSIIALNRVLNHVSKGLLLFHVIKPEAMQDSHQSSPACLAEFQVYEILMKRWVPEGSREEEE